MEKEHPKIILMGTNTNSKALLQKILTPSFFNENVSQKSYFKNYFILLLLLININY